MHPPATILLITHHIMVWTDYDCQEQCIRVEHTMPPAMPLRRQLFCLFVFDNHECKLMPYVTTRWFRRTSPTQSHLSKCGTGCPSHFVATTQDRGSPSITEQCNHQTSPLICRACPPRAVPTLKGASPLEKCPVSPEIAKVYGHHTRQVPRYHQVAKRSLGFIL